MTKKILYILLGSIFVFGVLFLLWSWLFGPSNTANTNTGLFGSASSTGQTYGGSTDTGNGQTQLGNNASNGTITIGNNVGQNTGAGGGVNGITNGTNGSNTTGGGSNTAGNTTGFTTSGSVNIGNTAFGTSTTPWLGTIGSASGGSGVNFTPTEINSVTGGIGGGAPTIINGQDAGSSGTSLITALAGAAIAGTVSCGIRAAAITSGAAAGGSATAAVLAQKPISVPVSTASDPVVAYNAASQTALQNGSEATSFAGCIVNVLAKAALQQITVSVVNWINSGFNGQPSFITNYNQFFTNVADAAAGQFIKGSDLAFLCSPFKLQIKVAVAQSYARRNDAQSCTLTSIIKNANSFMNGNFSQGGWQGLLSYTTVPTNNPYGAYSYAQIGLTNAQNSAVSNATKNISPTGFLNLQQLTGCTNPANNGISAAGSGLGINPQAAVAGGKTALPDGCKPKVVTPGGAIAASLDKTLGQGQDQLGLGNSLDQIFNALTTQLLTKSLYGGLSSLSGQTTTEDTGSEQKAATMILDMQNNVTIAQQYGNIEQGSIRDIQDAQQRLTNAFNCWSNAASSTGLTTAQVAIASQNATTANATISTLGLKVDQYNNNITSANSVIATLQELITEATQASSATDVNNIATAYANAGPFISQNDVTTEQQNRVTLQSQVTATNQATQSSLAQCTAFGH